MFGLNARELALLRPLDTPIRIQDFLDRFPCNLEKGGQTYRSPRRALASGKMHCLEGALVAALALWLHRRPPLLLDLKTEEDVDHVVALYRVSNRWGAISKTNHATLRFRDPVYATIRELALSYFHEYFDNETGIKLLRSHSTRPFDLRRLGTGWVTARADLHGLAAALDEAPHSLLVPRASLPHLRLADAMERKAGRIVEWSRRDPRT